MRRACNPLCQWMSMLECMKHCLEIGKELTGAYESGLKGIEQGTGAIKWGSAADLLSRKIG